MPSTSPRRADHVHETSTTTGATDWTLDGAAAGARTFLSALGSGAECYYSARHDTVAGEWEDGIGVVGAGTLTRAHVIDSSAGGGAKTVFSAGTKRIVIAPLADFSGRHPLAWPRQSAYEERFGREGATAPPAGLAWENQGAAIYSEDATRGRIVIPAQAPHAIRGLVRAEIGASWEYEFRAHIMGGNSGGFGAWMGIGVFESVSGKYQVLLIRPNNAEITVTRWASATTYNSDQGSTYTTVAARNPICARVVKSSATDYDFEVSADGEEWLTVLDAHDLSGWMTPDNIFVGGSASDSGRDAIVSIEVVRSV